MNHTLVATSGTACCTCVCVSCPPNAAVGPTTWPDLAGIALFLVFIGWLLNRVIKLYE